MTKLDSHLENVRSHISSTGGKSVRLNVKEQIIKDLKLTYTDRMSNIEDADIAEAIINLKARELAYNASLNSSSQIMKMSLVNYL
jgi:flagellar hook-associated protein 3 FlgL